MTDVDPPRVSEAERLRRWRLVLGGGDADGTGAELGGDDQRIDAAMAAVYDHDGADSSVEAVAAAARPAGSVVRRPRVARWLGDIRTYFPKPVVQVMQRDAIERLDLRQLLLEPELLESIEPDIHLVTLLVELNHLLPDETRATARQVIAQVLERARGNGSPTAPGSPSTERSPVPTGRVGRAPATSTGCAPCTPTCATTSRSTAP